MNKAIRIAVAAAFGVAAALPAFADFENYGPTTRQNEERTSLQEVNPPSLDSNPVSALDESRSDRHFRSDRRFDSDSRSGTDQMASDGEFRSERRERYSADGRYLGPRDSLSSRGIESHQHSRVYGGTSEPGSFSEPSMPAGEFRWEGPARS